jgi:general L-amino acid transport system permease protein
VAVVAAAAFARHARRRRDRTGRQPARWWPSLAILIGIPWLAVLWRGAPIAWEHPVRGGFNYEGGIAITPEFAAMLVGLVFYTGGFIAEIVRSGIEAVARGQMEAALGIGLTRAQALRLVILPQARRTIVPPLTSTYLGTIKDSSLGVAIGYPELVSVGGTILDASGQTLEILGLTILFYMTTTLVVSTAMRAYEARIRAASR